MIFKVFFLISVVCLSQAFAGYEVGNGGSVVVCRDALNNILSVELLDIYEQRVKSKLSIKEFEEKYSESVNWYDLISSTSPQRIRSIKALFNFWIKYQPVSSNRFSR